MLVSQKLEITVFAGAFAGRVVAMSQRVFDERQEQHWGEWNIEKVLGHINSELEHAIGTDLLDAEIGAHQFQFSAKRRGRTAHLRQRGA